MITLIITPCDAEKLSPRGASRFRVTLKLSATSPLNITSRTPSPPRLYNISNIKD
jgi:hypothetical protein